MRTSHYGAVLAVLMAHSLVAQEPRVPAPLRGVELTPTHLFQVGGGTANAAAFHPDGRLLATGGERGDVILWDVATQAKKWQRAASDHWIGALEFSPGGERLAAMGRSLTIWRTSDGEKLNETVAGGPHGVAWSRDGKRLAYHSGNGVVNVLDTSDYSLQTSFNANERYPVNSVAFDRTGAFVFATDNGGKVWRFEVATRDEQLLYTHTPLDAGTNWGQLVGQLDGELCSVAAHGDLRIGDLRRNFGATVHATAVNRAGTRLAVGGDDGSVAVYDSAGDAVAKWRIGGAISALALAPHDERLLCTTTDGALILFDGAKEQHRWQGHPSETVHSLAFSADSKYVAASGKNTVVLELATGRTRSFAQSLTMAPGHEEADLLVLGSDGLVLWDARRGAARRVLEEPTGWRAPQVALSPDGQRAIIGGGLIAGKTRILDLVNGTASTLPGFGRCLDVGWSADGHRYALARVSGNHGEFGDLRVRDAQGKIEFSVDYRAGVDTVAFSPSGHYLVFAVDSGSLYDARLPTLHLLDATTFEEKRVAEIDVSWWRFVHGDLAVSHDYDQLTLWYAPGFVRLQQLPRRGIRVAALAPDGDSVAIADDLGVQVFEIVRKPR